MVHTPYGALTLYGAPHSRRLRCLPLLANTDLTYNSTSAFTPDDSVEVKLPLLLATFVISKAILFLLYYLGSVNHPGINKSNIKQQL